VATFGDGTSVRLTATAAGRSRFAGWTGDCSGTAACVLSMTANHSVTAKFVRPLSPCVVPTVRGLTLRKAATKLRRAHCSLGKVTRKAAPARKRGKVLAQKPKPGAKLRHGAKVNVTVGKR
jgi:beta-lactam-binding protein with PASTA domain